MIIPKANIIFDGLPPAFTSLFPGTDAYYSARYSSFQSKLSQNGGPSVAEALFAQSQAQAWHDAIRLVNAKAAQTVGTLLSSLVPEIAWEVGSGLQKAREGLFASIEFGLSANPEEILEKLKLAGLEIALQVVQGVPIVGQTIGAIVGIGRLLFRIFNRPDPVVPPLFIPWERYSKTLDEDIVKDQLIGTLSAGVDWTDAFMPPYVARPWLLGQGVHDGQPVEGGQVFAPLDGGGNLDYSGGLGCIPGTVRVAGHIQRVMWREGHSSPRLLRYFREWITASIPWGSQQTDVGDYFPSLAQAGAGMWQQMMKAGTPWMYMAHATKMKDAWGAYFESFYNSAFGRYPQDPSSGELTAPYIAVYKLHAKSDAAASWRLGIQHLERPSPAPFITPNIFKQGPATPATRTDCLFIEETVKRRTGAWPWSTQPGQQPTEHPDMLYRAGAYTDAKGQTAISEAARWMATKAGLTACLGDPFKKCVEPVPEGYRCVPWPTGEELLSGYARADEAIIGPACNRLLQLQRRCLESTLVSAYVRPDGPNRFGAFKDQSLSDKCIAMRKVLLQHPVRFKVILKDVKDIDQEFWQALVDSGVKNTPDQLAGLGVAAGGVGGAIDPEDEEPLPEPLPPAAGVAFDFLPPARYSLLWGAN